jgi:hypothetical protein
MNHLRNDTRQQGTGKKNATEGRKRKRKKNIVNSGERRLPVLLTKIIILLL